MANRHACCVCQKTRVQIHHIDGDPSNNDPKNLAAVCLEHHDMATATSGLTKKLKPDDVRAYKEKWEAACACDILALARKRFTFYYCIYKNPQRLREAYAALAESERQAAVLRVLDRLTGEQEIKAKDDLWGMNAVPEVNEWTKLAVRSVYMGEPHPSFVKQFKPHPLDPHYSTETPTQDALAAYHLYDLWCQVVGQTLAEARGTMPLEDLYLYETEEELDDFAGQLVTFRLSIRGKNIALPRQWEEVPVGTLTATAKVSGRRVKVKMQIRTMYMFSDTSAINLARGRISGLGIFQGGVVEGDTVELIVVPLLIGAGGWNLYPEQYPREYR
ncbi:HNH endonuclease signature motif containing protein [Sphingomonas sp.]|uniref:HNH endonuclease signature motif containing protein n=1 Tax=Sphingomonas sp. TaxID=28214 RepID=UPI0025D12A2C|nr:HNH endonuclease signature motif containing protein [Sphingomonas sp.]